MEPQAAAICQKLAELGIEYAKTEHEPLFTIEELVLAGLDRIGEVPKNLFLRDDSGKHHYLIVMQKDKQADLSAIRKSIGCSRLSFASQERLQRHLSVPKGSVTPLAVLFDRGNAVRVYMDRDLLAYPRLGVHPGINTSTVWLRAEDLLAYLADCGHESAFLSI